MVGNYLFMTVQFEVEIAVEFAIEIFQAIFL